MTGNNSIKPFNEYTEEEVAEANRQIYSHDTGYDGRVITKDSKNRLESILEAAVALVKSTGPDAGGIKVLDACGGSGNASFILDGIGCEVTLVDISQQMVDSFNRKCGNEKKKIASLVADTKSFLETSNQEWDIICFSSALHHFRHPDAILFAALQKIRHGGVIVTVADPTQNINKRLFKLASLFDRALNLLLKDPLGLTRKISAARFGKSFRKSRSSVSAIPQTPGRVAEYHAQTGIDDTALIKNIISKGYTVILHHRYSAGYTLPFRLLYKFLKTDTSFCMIVSNAKYETVQVKGF